MEKIAHFAHNPGEGTPLCEEYHPGSDHYGYPGDPLADGGVPLYLHLDHDGGLWTLFIEFDPLFSNESRQSMPALLAFDGVELHRPGTRPRKLPAVSLWPGSGRSAMTVEPSRQRTKLRTISRWVTGIPLERWRRQLAGFGPHGVLFVPYRGGMFRRFDWSTPVYWGDRVIVVGSAQSAPPLELKPVPLTAVTTGENVWHAWSVLLPRVETYSARSWLAKFGVTAEERRRRTTVVTPAVEYGSDGIPRYLLGDPIVVTPSAQATVLVAESHATINAARLPRTTSSAAFHDRSVTAIESGILRLRTDAKRDVLHVEIVTEISVPSDELAPAWAVTCDGSSLSPFSSHKLSSRDARICIDTAIAALTFTVTARLPSNRTERLRCADATAATDWLRSHTDTASEIEIDAGNFGFVELIFEPSTRTPHTEDRHRSNWGAAYAISAGDTDDPGGPHWNVGRRGGSCRSSPSPSYP